MVGCFDRKVKPKKLVQKRINSSGDELQNQVDAGWVNVSMKPSANCTMHKLCLLLILQLASACYVGEPVLDDSH